MKFSAVLCPLRTFGGDPKVVGRRIFDKFLKHVCHREAALGQRPIAPPATLARRAGQRRPASMALNWIDRGPQHSRKKTAAAPARAGRGDGSRGNLSQWRARIVPKALKRKGVISRGCAQGGALGRTRLVAERIRE